MAGAVVAGKRDRGRGVHGEFFPTFSLKKTHPTLRFDLQGWYRIEEGKEVKILGPVALASPRVELQSPVGGWSWGGQKRRR